MTACATIPNEMLIYRELAWFFQHKMGQNLDDANMYYKQQWANEMAVVFGKQQAQSRRTDPSANRRPEQRAQLLREKYKMDPEIMKEVDDTYGPLEWRLPEAHAIYWAAMGLKAASEKSVEDQAGRSDHPAPGDLSIDAIEFSARAAGDQSLRRRPSSSGRTWTSFRKVSHAYEQAAGEDAANHDHYFARPPEFPARCRLFSL